MLSFADNNLNINVRKVDLLSTLIIIQRNHARTNGPIFLRRTQKLPRRIRYYVVAATPFISPTRAIIFSCLRSVKHPIVFLATRHAKRKIRITESRERASEKIEGKSIRDWKRRRSRIRAIHASAFVCINVCDAGIGSDCVNRPSACVSKTIDKI